MPCSENFVVLSPNILISVAISIFGLYFLYANTRIAVTGSAAYRKRFKTFFCFFQVEKWHLWYV